MLYYAQLLDIRCKEADRMRRKPFRERHPDFPIWISAIALIVSIAIPIVRTILARTSG